MGVVVERRRVLEAHISRMHRQPARGPEPMRLGLDAAQSTFADGDIGRYVEELTVALLQQARADANLLL